MRKVVLGLGISLDGYIARPDGSVDFLFMPKDFSMQPFVDSVDAGIMGRKTFDVAADGAASFGGSTMVSYVMSRTLPAGERNGAHVVRESPTELVRRIRAKPGRNIWLMGGGEIVREFLKEDLVDEMEIGVVPVLIGEGIPLFPAGFPQREFKLLENNSYSKGLIVLKYERVRT
jgi:dihydrofolate reductase